jgi:hypothetical protein
MIDRIMVVNVIGGFCLIALIGIIFAPGQEQPIELKFKVVDSYHGCDIVRYTDRTNLWHYFMDCKSSTGVK